MNRIRYWLLCGSFCASCGGTADLGNGTDGQPVLGTASGGTGGTGGTGGVDCPIGDNWPDPTAEDGVMQFEASEIWRGYVVSPVPPIREPGDVTLYVQERTATGITGAVVFGDGTPPAPATDPDVGYPPGAYTGIAGGPNGTGFWNGHALSIRKGSIDGARVRFEVASGEQYKRWCALQVSYSVGEDQFACVDGDRGQQTPDGCFIGYEQTGLEPVDCGKLALCHGSGAACNCSQCGCTASDEAVASFDVRLEGDELSGFVNGMAVYLTRDVD